MSRDDVEVVRRAFEAYARRAVDSLLALLDHGGEVRSLITRPSEPSIAGIAA
jgi:ketosteroid isomerase-like protein